MSIENAGDAPDPDLPRFLVAVLRYEIYLKNIASEQPKTDDVPTVIADTMLACGGLGRIAQNYEFISTHPDLANTRAATMAAEALTAELARPEIPDTVRQIYTDLYGLNLSDGPNPS